MVVRHVVRCVGRVRWIGRTGSRNVWIYRHFGVRFDVLWVLMVIFMSIR